MDLLFIFHGITQQSAAGTTLGAPAQMIAVDNLLLSWGLLSNHPSITRVVGLSSLV